MADVLDVITNIDIENDGTGRCWDEFNLDENFIHDLNAEEIKEFHEIQSKYYDYLKRFELDV